MQIGPVLPGVIVTSMDATAHKAPGSADVGP
jgi:hypothetical protein